MIEVARSLHRIEEHTLRGSDDTVEKFDHSHEGNGYVSENEEVVQNILVDRSESTLAPLTSTLALCRVTDRVR
ncbi:hypothetical protein [Sinomonas sp. G460-2]|uniref:hypothetical protein n=1 Tax=Sinomonas sp. G460-2 TaxID=3393464 RepID=UPI0039EE0416